MMENRRYSKRIKLREYTVAVEDYIEAGDYSVSPIYKLPDHLFLKIFSHLSLRDKFRIQRVCKFWQRLSLETLASYKTLTFGIEDWDNEIYYDSIVNRCSLLRKVLNVCGSSLTFVDLSVSSKDTVWSRCTKKFGKNIFTAISDLCPNLTAINFGKTCPYSESLQPFFQSVKGLQDLLIISDDYYYYDWSSILTEAFKNNQKLRKLVLLGGADKINDWKYLNSKNIEEIGILMDNVQNSFCTALKNFVNLKSIEIHHNSYKSYIRHRYILRDDHYNYYNDRIEDMLNSLISIEKNLKRISFKIISHNQLAFPEHLAINSKQIAKFTNLETLELSGYVLNLTTEFFEAVGKKCLNLKRIYLDDLKNICNVKMFYVTELPKLEELTLSRLEEITDIIFTNDLFALKKLHCSQCKSLGNVGLCEFIRRSKTIKYIEIKHCKNMYAGPIFATISNSELSIKFL